MSGDFGVLESTTYHDVLPYVKLQRGENQGRNRRCIRYDHESKSRRDRLRHSGDDVLGPSSGGASGPEAPPGTMSAVRERQ